ncbi:F-box protein At2g39490 isoform X1 [Cajanus cajan]|uniref:F-box protein At2g39490 family n=1 Tax=Cajanus cajan TaxID=3821 RepID=A0A151U813_CAJCA|nr:F-box protein At2g39490 isoform X1 [Cajanus cajan]KYP75439.1 F-box protein At2g39490 family [Cajanus cajan]
MEASVEDPFSNLPDEILSCIVSFLPSEYALETSLISTRWKDLWNQVLIRQGTTQDIAAAVAEFLARFEELDPLKHPRKLQFHFAQDTALFASIATNGKLLLDFPCGSQHLERKYEMQFMLNKHHTITHHTFLVKTLYLKSVRDFTSEVASSIVSNLEHLEKLVIVECMGLQSLCVESESKLHKLTILDCMELKSLHLRTSKLKTFTYRGPLPRIWPESHFNLSHAMLDFRHGPSCGDFKAQDFNETLLTIKNSEALTLCEWTFEALIWPSISPSVNFIFYRIRELWWIHNHKGENSIDTLVSFLKLCPALEQLFVTSDPTCYSAPGSISCLTQSTKNRKLEHVKRITFMGFTKRVDEISVAKELIELVKGEPPKIETSDGNWLDVVFVHCAVSFFVCNEERKMI